MTITIKAAPDASSYLRSLSPHDFMALGVRQIAYVKPIRVDNNIAFVVHAADGTPLSVHEDASGAITTVRNNEMHPVTLH